MKKVKKFFISILKQVRHDFISAFIFFLLFVISTNIILDKKSDFLSKFFGVCIFIVGLTVYGLKQKIFRKVWKD